MIGASPCQIVRTIPVLIAICLFALPAHAKYSGGTGEPNDPYQIATAADLIALGETPADYDKHFILTADIDLDPNLPGRKVFDKAVIAPNRGPVNVSFQGPGFAGVFDGNGHMISHLTVSGQDYVGLFGGLGQWAARGEVKNLGLVDVDITRSNAYVGGLVGYNGLGTVTQCYSTGAVSGKTWVGGLVGMNYGTVTCCYSTGAVNGSQYVGGLVGYNGGTVTDCYSTGVVRGGIGVGGLVASNEEGGTVTECYSTGAVSGTESVGGLVGSNAGSVTQCHSSAPVIGGNWVGGLVGANYRWVYDGSVTQCYSTGAVRGTGEWVGGLVGGNSGGSVVACFWDTQTSGQTRSAGGTGKTTAQMQSIETYLEAGWDFVGETKNGTHEVWQMPQGGGYPILSVFHGYAPPQLKGAGTAENPYLIHDVLELGAMVHYSDDAHYRLAVSIDLSGIRWGVPVIRAFAGTFDGNSYTISHLTIQGVACLGLFGELASGAEVRDLGVVDVNVTGSSSSVGALAGENWGAVTQCYSTGTVSGKGYVGGLVGWLQWGGTMTQCYSTGAVSGTGQCVGGLVGSNGMFESGSGTVTGCHSSGSVSGASSVGGLVGSNWGTVAASYSASAVRGTQWVGGLVGANAEIISDSGAMGTVAGGSFVGGLAGTNGFIVTVYDIKAAFVYPGSIFNSYAAGSVNGDKYAGGLVGANREGTVVHCYSTAAVRGNESVGGLVGGAWNRTSTAACFWDTQTSGQATSAGGTGKTTAEMQTAKTFLDAGWDFVGETANGTEDLWWILEGKDYPRLSWELIPEN